MQSSIKYAQSPSYAPDSFACMHIVLNFTCFGSNLHAWSYMHILKASKNSREGFCIHCLMPALMTKCWEGYTHVLLIFEVQDATIFSSQNHAVQVHGGTDHTIATGPETRK